MNPSKMGTSRAALRNASGASRGRGRGIVIKVFKNGKQFRNRINYINDPGKGGHIILSNCPLNEISTFMKHVASLRPDISKPVGHLSVSLPIGIVPKSDDEWRRIVNTLRDEIGLDERFPYACATHRNTAHDHLHIVFSRISVDGRVHDQANIGLRLQVAEVTIEDKFNLQLFCRSEFSIKITKNEIEMEKRTNKRPPRLKIRNALEVALKDKPSIQQLIRRLEIAGVSTRFNTSPSTGRIIGLSFAYDGIPFPASKIGKEFGWSRLRERIVYEQRELATLVENPSPDDAPPERTQQVGSGDEFRDCVLPQRHEHLDPPPLVACDIRDPLALVKVHRTGFETPTWVLPGESHPVGVLLASGGVSFPDHHRLSDEQLTSIIGTVGNSVILLGDDEYLERAAGLCQQLGITYEFERSQKNSSENEIELDSEQPQTSLIPTM